jgi:hypothetical protein
MHGKTTIKKGTDVFNAQKFTHLPMASSVFDMERYYS